VELVICASPEGVTAVAADHVQRVLDREPFPVLGLATGGTPMSLYRELARRGTRASSASVFMLDEYIGLPAEDPCSYAHYARTHIGEPLGVLPDRLHVLDGMTQDLDAEARRYERAISSAGGVDLQLLGIGRNGHIAFNEPGSSFGSRTRAVTLSPTTRSDNARFFPDGRVPRRALTQGVGTVLEARRLLLVAVGAEKAGAVADALLGPVTRAVPASAIRRHPRCTVLLDPAAARHLQRVDYPAVASHIVS
jgi:glucosamine-6-phosphate deaminase